MYHEIIIMNYSRNDILCLEFDSICEMRNLLESSATKYEGFIENRVGYNFPSSYIHTTLPGLKQSHKYVIGYLKGDKKTAIHEMCHAMFYCDNSYRKKWTKKWNSLNFIDKRKISKKLTAMGYSNNVLIDEYQAYSQDFSNLF